MRLVQADGRIRLVTNKTAQDHTTRMHGYARRRLEELADSGLFGFVLKKDSPTCGLERVKVYGTAGMPVKSGRGLFADALVTRFPLLPVEEEGRLNDPRLRENFIERIFAYRRLTAVFAVRWSMGDVVRFHTAHKLTLMAHRPEAYQRLGRLVASGKAMARREFQDRYSTEFMNALETHRHAAPAGQRAAAHARLLQARARPREPRRAARAHRGPCDRAGAAGRAAHALRPSHPAVRCALSGGSGVFAATPGRADAAQPRMSAMTQRVVVNDRMQRGYVYWRTEPVGRNFAPAFKPELTPKEMLRLGVFGGKYLTDCRAEFPTSWFAGARLCAERHDGRLNCFGVNASQSLAVWRRSGWIHRQDPRGWFQWYCRYYMGRRSADDVRQIRRWRAITRHVAAIRNHCERGDLECRRKQRQAVLHWAYDARRI